jgi:HD-like signal output (HDOD) protein
MSGHGAKFGPKKEAAIAALLTQRTSEEAARSIGIGPATLRRWQKDPEFAAVLRAARKDAYRQTIGRMHHLSSAAVSTLGRVMLDEKTPPATKVRAADSILNHTAKAIEIEELDARLTELEAATEANKDERRR